jgi:hypothetical protein
MKRSLEVDLIDCQPIKDKVRKDREYAERLYAALCNIQWYPIDSKNIEEDVWSCSWRGAGEIVGTLCNPMEDYLSFYCSGGEGNVVPNIEKDLRELGWTWREWPKEEKE